MTGHINLYVLYIANFYYPLSADPAKVNSKTPDINMQNLVEYLNT